VSVPGGSFRIGDQFDEGSDDEQNNRKITIQPFHLGATEVTQGQWKAVMRTPQGSGVMIALWRR
jgi:formylglycine-generating enzyme required for sulfatase activity